MKILTWLDENIESFVLIILSILTVVVIFVQVIMRYVMGSSLVWSEELARYAFIWLVYIGVSYGVKRQAHISVDALNLVFKKKGKFVLAMCANIAVLVFVVLLTYFSFEVVTQINRMSPAMGIPLKYVYAAPLAGFLLTAIRVIQNMRIQTSTFRTGE
ncbi:TRAP-type C4-dicarboxylate transport system permease small subunit [Neobacillus niacini]|uniref:TRAP transporter small permease n=1 Tax=Neobacillus niacini TaxID=86668 RepID=UPI0027821C4D|nr:TRAP transporter small permease [Neobacillus niacini]MDQ0999707.1 TRAP-type C4-dicarboxylate transport system permease small subunit [Neobacillus niacini]